MTSSPQLFPMKSLRLCEGFHWAEAVFLFMETGICSRVASGERESSLFLAVTLSLAWLLSVLSCLLGTGCSELAQGLPRSTRGVGTPGPVSSGLWLPCTFPGDTEAFS